MLFWFSESLDELTELVVPLFQDVTNKNVDIPEWLQHPASAEFVKVSLSLWALNIGIMENGFKNEILPQKLVPSAEFVKVSLWGLLATYNVLVCCIKRKITKAIVYEMKY